MRRALIGLTAAFVALVACVSIWPAFGAPVKWTPDGLFYEARVLEFRGTPDGEAMKNTFEGPISASLRARDPQKTGNAEWVKYNEPFYERRVTVPLAGAALYGLSGTRTLLYLSIAGYIAAVLALFGLLLLKFRLPIAGGVAVAAAFLPPLVDHSSYPLTDSWGLTLEIVAFAAAILTLERDRRWLALWIATILLLSFTRDSAWVPVLATGWVAFRSRKRLPLTLFGTGVVAALPAVLAIRTPARDLLALLVNNSKVPSDTSWGFIIRHYPSAAVELVRSDVGFLRRGEWYTALFLIGGLLAMLLLARRRRSDRTWSSLLTAGFVFGVGYVLAAPVFSAFRLELVFVPMAAFGLALALELALARAAQETNGLERLAPRVPVRIRR